MTTKTLFGLGMAALMLTGCESTKEEVVAQDYVLIVHNVSSAGCSFVGIGEFKSQYGLEKHSVLYHEDVDNTIDCDDYEHEANKSCWEESLTGSGTGTGNHACAIGIDEVTEPDTTYEDAVKQQKYVAIIPHVSSLACTKGGIDEVLKDHGYTGRDYVFTQERSDITCSRFPDTTCQVLDGPQEGEAGYSDRLACVIGTDDAELTNP
jgi:hypothetical protein